MIQKIKSTIPQFCFQTFESSDVSPALSPLKHPCGYPFASVGREARSSSRSFSAPPRPRSATQGVLGESRPFGSLSVSRTRFRFGAPTHLAPQLGPTPACAPPQPHSHLNHHPTATPHAESHADTMDIVRLRADTPGIHDELACDSSPSSPGLGFFGRSPPATRLDAPATGRAKAHFNGFASLPPRKVSPAPAPAPTPRPDEIGGMHSSYQRRTKLLPTPTHLLQLPPWRAPAPHTVSRSLFGWGRPRRVVRERGMARHGAR